MVRKHQPRRNQSVQALRQDRYGAFRRLTSQADAIVMETDNAVH